MTADLSATATATATVIEDVKEWRGQDVLDREGEKLGKLEEVFYDTETDLPAFAAVKSGLFGKHLTLAPLAAATAGQAFLRLAVAKAEFKNAPSFDPDAELTIEDEISAYDYYGLQYAAVGQDARRLAKH